MRALALHVSRAVVPLGLVLDDDMGLDGEVRHRQERDASIGQPPAGAQSGGHLGEREALPQPLAARDVGPEVAVAEAEPLRLGPVCRELALDSVGLVRPTPALVLVDATAKGVHDRVEVRADAQPEQRDVVTGVADHGDRGVGQGGRAVEVGAQTTQEACTAHSAGQGRDARGGCLSGRIGGRRFRDLVRLEVTCGRYARYAPAQSPGNIRESLDFHV